MAVGNQLSSSLKTGASMAADAPVLHCFFPCACNIVAGMENSFAKMTVVSLLTIIIELSAFYQEYGEFSGRSATDTMEHYIEAFCET